jgi:Fic family protein
MPFELNVLPPPFDFETVPILKKTASTHRYLAELKGISETIPNQSILINTLSLQEAQDSSAIENIITTQDDLYKDVLFPEYSRNIAAKEVRRYAKALKTGYELIRSSQLLTINHIVEIQQELEKNRAGIRKIPGTELKNESTGEVIYTPPQNENEIRALLTNLETFMNDDSFFTVDPLIKMAIIHYQFESIHPFYDGNGRTGRIINVLYLVLKELLNIPVLYLSHSIVETKSEYYRLLQSVRTNNSWEEWILYMLDCVEVTSKRTIQIVQAIRTALMDYKHKIRSNHKFYTQDLINHLFAHPYTTIESFERDLGISRLTSAKYLDILTSDGFLKKEKYGRSYCYINVALIGILANSHGG